MFNTLGIMSKKNGQSNMVYISNLKNKFKAMF